MDTTEEDAPKRRERPRRDSETLTSFPHPLSKETDLAMGEGAEGKKVKGCQFGTFVYFMIKNKENQKLTSISIFDFKRKSWTNDTRTVNRCKNSEKEKYRTNKRKTECSEFVF